MTIDVLSLHNIASKGERKYIDVKEKLSEIRSPSGELVSVLKTDGRVGAREGSKEVWLIAVADFCGGNAATRADFKLL